jgi:hypothetical protein
LPSLQNANVDLLAALLPVALDPLRQLGGTAVLLNSSNEM